MLQLLADSLPYIGSEIPDKEDGTGIKPSTRIRADNSTCRKVRSD